MTIKIPTRLEELYTPGLIGILMQEPAFIKILSSFGEYLLQNFHLAIEIEKFGVNRKINNILRQYCQKYGSEANYERICEILVEKFGLHSLAEKVKIEANKNRPRTVITGTKIEHSEIPDLVKILSTNENLMGDLMEFKNLLGVKSEWQPNSKPKTQLSHVMYNFRVRFPQKATYEFLTDILENEMGLHQLAVKVRGCKGLVGKAQAKSQIPKHLQAPPLASSSKFSKACNKSNQMSQTENLFEEKITVRPMMKPEIFEGKIENSDSDSESDDSKYERCEVAIEMSDGETGINYETIFEKYCNSYVVKIVVEDPYLISEQYQVDNFQEFLNFVLKSCRNLSELSVLSSERYSDEKIVQRFEINCRAQNPNMEFKWKFNDTFHDRLVRFYYLKQVQIEMGRGMDIFKNKNKGNSSGQRECRPCRIRTIHCNPTDKYKIVRRGQTQTGPRPTATATPTTSTPPSPKASTSGTQQQSNGNNQNPINKANPESPKNQKPFGSTQTPKKEKNKKPSLASKALSVMSGGKFGNITSPGPVNPGISNAGHNTEGVKSGSSWKKENKINGNKKMK